MDKSRHLQVAGTKKNKSFLSLPRQTPHFIIQQNNLHNVIFGQNNSVVCHPYL